MKFHVAVILTLSGCNFAQQLPQMKEALKIFLKDIFNNKASSLGAGTMVRRIMPSITTTPSLSPITILIFVIKNIALRFNVSVGHS